MKKKYYKKIIYILLTILIILILIMSILYIFEKIYSLSNEVKWNYENDIINNMNVEKLSNYGWGATE